MIQGNISMAQNKRDNQTRDPFRAQATVEKGNLPLWKELNPCTLMPLGSLSKQRRF